MAAIYSVGFLPIFFSCPCRFLLWWETLDTSQADDHNTSAGDDAEIAVTRRGMAQAFLNLGSAAALACWASPVQQPLLMVAVVASLAGIFAGVKSLQSAHNRQLKLINEKLTHHKSQLSALKADVQTKEEQLAAKSKELDRMTSQLDALKTVLQAKDRREEQLKVKMDELGRKASEATALQANQHANEEQLKRKVDELTHKGIEAAALQADLDTSKERQADLQRVCEELRARIAVGDTEWATLRQRLTGKDSQLQEKDKELISLRQQVVARRAEVVRFESTVADKQKQVQQTNTELQRLETLLAGKDSELTKSRGRLEEKERALQQTQGQRDEAERQGQEARARLDQANARIRGLEERLHCSPHTPPRALFGADGSATARSLFADPQVYVTASGRCFHLKKICGNSSPTTTVRKPLSEAKQKNLTLCQNCKRSCPHQAWMDDL